MMCVISGWCIMLCVLKKVKFIFFMLCSILIVLCRLDFMCLGRLVWVRLLVIIVVELKFSWVRNIFICFMVVFCVLFRIMNVLLSVCLCM